MNDGTRLDDAIDRAVREIMRRDPPAGLRGRVLSRLDEPARRLRLWPGAVAATAAVALIAAFLLRGAPPAPPRDAPVVARTETPAATPASVPATPRPAPVAAEPPAARRGPAPAPVRMATFAPRDGRISAASVSTVAREPDAAAAPQTDDLPVSPLPPLVVAPLLPPSPLTVPPIVVPPLHVVRPPVPPEESPR